MEPTVEGIVFNVRLPWTGAAFVEFDLVEQRKDEPPIRVRAGPGVADSQITFDGRPVNTFEVVREFMRAGGGKAVQFACKPEDLGFNYGVTTRCAFTTVDESSGIARLKEVAK